MCSHKLHPSQKDEGSGHAITIMLSPRRMLSQQSHLIVFVDCDFLPPSSLIVPHTHTQAFYQLCLNSRNLSGGSHDGSGSVPSINNLTCAGYVCTNPMPEYLNSDLCGNDFCFQPYSFICILPLEILWYIIYWLFFVLSW